MIYRDAQVEAAPAMACSGAVLALAPGPARPQRRLARERSGRGLGLGHRGVLAGGLEEEKGRSPPAAAKERRGCSPPATRRREGVLVASRGEEKGGSVLTILTNTEVWSSVSKVGKFSYGPIPWK